MNFIFMTIIALACWLYRKEMAVPLQMAEAIFLFWLQKLISDPRQRSVPNGHSNQAPNTSLGIRKYPWTHTRFYSPFWRNKPRHALSLQTGSVRAPKGRFCLFPLCSERVDEKNVKSLIFCKKTSNFLSSLPLRRKPLIINGNIMMHREIRNGSNKNGWYKYHPHKKPY